ncbi:tetratricopeptide repeat protein [Candidatus Falkowbacteria bacterium]|nr:tetratricopeptide repeat protein [Candidatus Falkowbacteria bacterium]
MIIVNVITLGVIIVCLLVIIAVVIKKFPQLTQIDVETLPETKAGETRERIVRAKLERNFFAKFRALSKRARPIGDRAVATFRTVFEATLALERKYREKLAPKTLAEKQKVDAKTEDLVKSGEELMAQDKFVEAERKFIDAIALDPHDSEAYGGLGALYWEQGKLDEARETFEHVLKLNADNYDAYAHLGNIARKQGKLENARDYQLKSIELDSQAVGHYLDLADVYEEMEELNSAFDCLQKALGLEPNNPRNLDAMVRLSIMMGKKEEAQTALKKLKEVNPDNQKLEELRKQIRGIK